MKLFISLYILVILLLLIIVVQSIKLVDLSVIKVLGSFKLPNNELIPSVFLSRSKLEVLEDDINKNDIDKNDKSSVILCDVLPILIQDPKGLTLLKEILSSSSSNTNNNEDMKSIPYRDSIQSYILNRDKGLYDNLPYSYKKGPSKKGLYDFFSNINSKVDVKKSNQQKIQINAYTSFLKGIEQQLDAKLTGLFIEVSDEISTNSVALGGAAIFAKTSNANEWILNQYKTLLPDIATTDEGISDDDIFNSPAVVVYCGLDEIAGMSLGSGMKIYMAEELFDAATVDARLNKKSDNLSMSISAPIFGDSKDRKKYNSLAVNKNEEADVPLAWEIYDPNKFMKMSQVEKRAILRASGVKKLPRPR